MARDESFGWNEAEVPLKTVFSPISLDFRAPLPPLLLPKIIASLCYSVSTLPGAGCSYHSALPLSPPSKCFSWEAACRHLSLPFPLLCLSLFLWRSVTFCTIFFPSDDTCGRITEEDRGVGGPRWMQRLISHMAAELYKYICCKRKYTRARWGMKGKNVLIYWHLFNWLFFLFLPPPLSPL